MKVQHLLAGIILLMAGCHSHTDIVPIKTPKIEVKKIDVQDSSSLSLTILKDGVDAALMRKKEYLKDSAAIENFIQANQSLINSNKIIIVFDPKTSYGVFKTILAILKRHNYLKIQMITK